MTEPPNGHDESLGKQVRKLRITLGFAAISLMALGLGPSNAIAGMTVDRFIGGTGPNGLEAGFSSPRDIAVNDPSVDDGHPAADGDVYVVEFGRVQRFEPNGDFVAAWGKDVIQAGRPGDTGTGYEICTVAADCKIAGFGSGKGELSEATGIAIDQVDGSVYVNDRQNFRIQKFTADGAFLMMLGDGVNNTNGSDRCTQASGHSCGSGIGGSAAGQLSDLDYFAVQPRLDVIPAGSDAGELVVPDSGNRRVAQLDPDASDPSEVFVRAWGWDVVPPGAPGNVAVNEVQSVTANGTAGTFKLSFEGKSTGAIAAGATSAAVQAALEGLSTVGAGNASVSGPAGGPWTVEYIGNLASVDVNRLEPSLVDQVIAVNASGGSFRVSSPNGLIQETEPIAFNATAEALEAALVKSNLDNLDPGEVAVSGPAGGPWTINVSGPQPPVALFAVNGSGLTGSEPSASSDYKVALSGVQPGGGFEICTGLCQAGGSKRGDFESLENGRFYYGLPNHVAVDAAGMAYVGDARVDARIMRFNLGASTPAAMLLPPILSAASGGPLLEAATVDTDGAEFLRGTCGLEVEADTQHLFVCRKPPSQIVVENSQKKATPQEALIQEIDTASLAEVADSPHGVGMRVLSTQSTGIGLNGAADRLFASIHSGFFVLDEDGAAPPSAVLDPVTGIGSHEADLSGEATSHGRGSYRFQYSLTGAADSWTDVAPPTPISGDDAHAVAAHLAGLEAGTTYHVRLVVDKVVDATGGVLSDISKKAEFTTSPEAPEAETAYVQYRTDDSARLLGFVNPNNGLTGYHFEYGATEAYGQSVPSPTGEVGGGSLVFVAEEIDGLLPNTTYHFRLVAQNAQGIVTTPDETFRTRSLAAEPNRAFEMVSPPFKTTRATVEGGGRPGRNANPGLASLDGESIQWRTSFFPLLEETAMPFNGDLLETKRTEEGWETHSLFTLPILPQYDAGLKDANPLGYSGDLAVGAWKVGSEGKPAALLPNEGGGPLFEYTRREGTGVKGWTGWLRNVDTQRIGDGDAAAFTDNGSAMARWGFYRGVAEDPSTVADDDRSDGPGSGQFDGTDGGQTVYLQLDPPLGELDLVNECTGTAAEDDRTELPARIGPGASNDTLGVRNCSRGQLTDRRGATLGGPGVFENAGNTALSEGGGRVFFTSPDPAATGFSASEGCQATNPLPSPAPATGANTYCPPQVYVRQYDAGGEPTVRWLSRPADGMPTQQIGLLGPAVFEGASRHGDVVYFKTSSPLTPDDPNGTGAAPVTTGSASSSSWDLYRYDLPDESDPADGVLTRVSGGPLGTADANTNPTLFGSNGAALRYLSDDGSRAYFVTGAPVEGVTASPKGGQTVPGGAPVDNPSVRNLYLYDTNAAGAERWTFIARLPASQQSGDYNACSTFDAQPAFNQVVGYGGKYVLAPGNCLRGTPDGKAIAFMTRGRLTADDRDDAADIYLYDAVENELMRVSAPPPGVDPYVCEEDDGAQPLTYCNGEMGYAPFSNENTAYMRGWTGIARYNLITEEDGVVSVIFNSRAQLTSDDENVDSWDVYRWRLGSLSLLSRGEPGDHSYYSGSSLDGEDIFIWTNDRIDPREIDDSDYDIYDLRIGDGFPYTPPVQPCDPLAFECEDEATPSPAASAPATSGFAGPGNVSAGSGRRPTHRCRKGKVRRRGRCVRRQGHRQGARATHTNGTAAR